MPSTWDEWGCLRPEVQNAVDAGALAATLQLYQDPREVREAEDAARRFVWLNPVGASMRVAEDLIDVETGYFDSDTKAFQAGAVEPNAVASVARTDREPFSFARVFGLSTYGSGSVGHRHGFPGGGRYHAGAGPLGVDGQRGADPSPVEKQSRFPIGLDRPIRGRRRSDRRDGTRHGPVVLRSDQNKDTPERMYNSGLHPTHDHYVGVLEAVLTSDFVAPASKLPHHGESAVRQVHGLDRNGGRIGRRRALSGPGSRSPPRRG